MIQYVKTIPISALQWTGDNLEEIKSFCTDTDGNVKCFTSNEYLWIETKEGQLKAVIGDYVMYETKGEFYLFGEHIFNKTYEEFYKKNNLL
jgi:hypothetical protein